MKSILNINMFIKTALCKVGVSSVTHEVRWFDRRCSKAHKDLWNLLHVIPQWQEKVKRARASYRLACKDRKAQLKEEAWEKLRTASQQCDSAAFWRVVNCPLFSSDHLSNQACTKTSQAWVDHFKAIYSPEEEDRESKYMRSDHLIVFQLSEVTVAISRLPPNKAPGPDGVPGDLFKSYIDLWAPLLTLHLNSVANGHLPLTWSQSIIVPVFKKGNSLDPACFRPISLIDSEVKIIGWILLDRLSDWAEEQGILSDLQYGFRPGRGTIEQNLNLCLLICKYTKVKKL